MKSFFQFVLLTAIALSIACAPGPTASEQGSSSEKVKPEEKPVDPTSDIEKDEVNLDNLDKPLIEDSK